MWPSDWGSSFRTNEERKGEQHCTAQRLRGGARHVSNLSRAYKWVTEGASNH